MTKLHFGSKGGVYYNKNKKRVYLNKKQKQNLFGMENSYDTIGSVGDVKKLDEEDYAIMEYLSKLDDIIKNFSGNQKEDFSGGQIVTIGDLLRLQSLMGIFSHERKEGFTPLQGAKEIFKDEEKAKLVYVIYIAFGGKFGTGKLNEILNTKGVREYLSKLE